MTHDAEPVTVDPAPPAPAAPVVTLDLTIDGMSCAACSARVERALRRQPGVQAADVNFATGQARVTCTPSDAAVARLCRAVREAGYTARPVEMTDAVPAGPWAGFAPVALGLVLTAPLVLPMLAWPWGVHWMPPPWVQLLLAAPVQFGLGARFYRAGWAALRARSGNMDLLVALGTSAAFALSLWLWLVHGQTHALYFEAAAVVVTLVRLGKWLEERARRQAGDALRSLRGLRPQQACLLRPDGMLQVLPPGELLPGDCIVVGPGERIAADGVVLAGETAVDESLLTGEPLPVHRGPGDRVIGGSINGEGRIEVRVTAAAAESALEVIIRRVADTQAAKPPIQRQVDRVSAVFVPVVLLLAAATWAGWLLAGAGVEAALVHAATVLVIACPCALGLATPAAIVAGTGVAARHGIVVRDVQALEACHRVDTVVFDKTGTLTLGRPVLVSLEPGDPGLPEAGTSPRPGSGSAQGAGRTDGRRAALLAVAARLSVGVPHPLARAVLAAGPAPAAAAGALRAVPGRGCTGMVDGDPWYLGSVPWMQTLGVDLRPVQPALSAGEAQGVTVSVLARATGPMAVAEAVLCFADTPRPGAAELLRRLRGQGLRLMLLSGDNRAAALAMARQLGLAESEVMAPVLPEEKLREIARLRAAGSRVAMVGDGVNDAPALAAADVGIAMGDGSDVALQAAAITLLRPEPQLVAAALDVGRHTVRKIRQNLLWAFAYNVAGLPLAAVGLVGPMFAGAAMALSSVSVMANALLLQRWRPAATDRR